MVAGKSTQKPHFVSISKDGDDFCPSFAQCYMCAHVVAAAENNGMLKEFMFRLVLYYHLGCAPRALFFA